ncbi:MAG: class B sortase [Ruminococcus sp.]|nr:class B sortase [Ruminococcus sp.]
MSMINEMAGVNKESDSSNFFVRFFKYFIPWKGDKAQEIVRKVIFIGSIVLFFSSLNELTDLLETNKDTLEYTEQIQSFEPTFGGSENGDSIFSGKKAIVDSNAAAPEKQQREVQEWAKKLLEKNEETVGWIKIPGFTNSEGKEYINFPVMQTDDNEYYLTHNIDRQPYESGSIYVDHVNKIDENGQPDNIVIYGHHMRKLGTSFTHLAEYKESVEVLKKHPVIEFNTIYDSNNCEYVIIGCFIGTIDETQDNGRIFDYWRYRNFDAGNYKFNTWIRNVEKASWYSCDVQCDPEDSYITLSTCSNEVADTRWVIVAKKLDEDDDKEKIISSYQEKEDKDIYFPEVWRAQWGNAKKYLGWSY